MSIEEAGQRIYCDGKGCEQTALLPVALRPLLTVPNPAVPSTEGWLFVAGKAGNRHFCPRCARNHLDTLTEAV